MKKPVAASCGVSIACTAPPLSLSLCLSWCPALSRQLALSSLFFSSRLLPPSLLASPTHTHLCMVSEARGRIPFLSASLGPLSPLDPLVRSRYHLEFLYIDARSGWCVGGGGRRSRRGMAAKKKPLWTKAFLELCMWFNSIGDRCYVQLLF